MRSRPEYRLYLAAALLLLLVAVPMETHAATVRINDGLAPPNPANVIDHATYNSDDVYVRNLPGDRRPCSMLLHILR